jgi:hypothetical protein
VRSHPFDSVKVIVMAVLAALNGVLLLVRRQAGRG